MAATLTIAAIERPMMPPFVVIPSPSVGPELPDGGVSVGETPRADSVETPSVVVRLRVPTAVEGAIVIRRMVVTTAPVESVMVT
ncbi:hypothetical protein BC829DRAFT_407819 [Chytridium lagenaria]|nr:hypothetical protein BC829DRAFT_407819 [Chytridium lagenaria]